MRGPGYRRSGNGWYNFKHSAGNFLKGTALTVSAAAVVWAGAHGAVLGANKIANCIEEREKAGYCQDINDKFDKILEGINSFHCNCGDKQQNNNNNHYNQRNSNQNCNGQKQSDSNAGAVASGGKNSNNTAVNGDGNTVVNSKSTSFLNNLFNGNTVSGSFSLGDISAVASDFLKGIIGTKGGSSQGGGSSTDPIVVDPIIDPVVDPTIIGDVVDNIITPNSDIADKSSDVIEDVVDVAGNVAKEIISPNSGTTSGAIEAAEEVGKVIGDVSEKVIEGGMGSINIAP